MEEGESGLEMVERWKRLRVQAVLALFLLGLGASLFVPASVSACSCAVSATVAQGYAQAQFVFSGMLVSQGSSGLFLEGTRFGSSGGPTLVRRNTFRVDTIWKGTAGSKLTVYDGGSEASCGASLTPGQRYLVYAYRSDSGRVATGLCTRTALYSAAADDLRQLGEGVKPPRGRGELNGTPEKVVGAAACGLVLIGAGYAILRRRRGRNA